jgi:hypothetical protein
MSGHQVRAPFLDDLVENNEFPVRATQEICHFDTRKLGVLRNPNAFESCCRVIERPLRPFFMVFEVVSRGIYNLMRVTFPFTVIGSHA